MPDVRTRPTPVADPGATGTRGTRGTRRDIQGLRALAVVLVLLYHAGAPVPGGFVGVDVFFVVSGFLITGLLLREVEQTGRVSLSRFWARRARRLLPAAALVLGATAALSWLMLPVTDRRTFGLDIVASAAYLVNWRLSARSVDYLAEDVGISPVQHFWSLAVEEQFYLVWPILLAGVAWWWRRRRRGSVRQVAFVAVLAVVIPSLAWSVVHTAAAPATAFFVTPTRLWELGVGALLAIAAPWCSRVPRIVAAILGWAGLAVVVATALRLPEGAPWPGSLALLPVLGTAALIVSGGHSSGPTAVLSWGPAVRLGGLSYSLYLWHWPLLVLAAAVWGELGTGAGLAVVTLSIVPAWLSWRYVENPMRYSRRLSHSPRASLATGALLTAVGVTAGLVLASTAPTPVTADGRDIYGAGVLAEDAPTLTGGDGTAPSLDDVGWFVPDGFAAPDDVPDAYEQGCQGDQYETEPVLCEYGDPDGDILVAVVGDSKVLQWETALSRIADREGWRVVSMTKSACPFTAADPLLDDELYASCAAWNDVVSAELTSLAPDVVLTSQGMPRAYVADDPGADPRIAMVDGLTETWSSLLDDGTQVGVILDAPLTPINVPECVAEDPMDLERCTFDRADAVALSAAPVQIDAAAAVPGVDLVDLTDTLCPSAMCVPVIGHTLVWRQGGHVTDTYVRTMTDAIGEQVVPLVEAAADAGSP